MLRKAKYVKYHVHGQLSPIRAQPCCRLVRHSRNDQGAGGTFRKVWSGMTVWPASSNVLVNRMVRTKFESAWCWLDATARTKHHGCRVAVLRMHTAVTFLGSGVAANKLLPAVSMTTYFMIKYGAATQSVQFGTSSGQWNLRRRPGARAPLGRRPCVPLPVLWHPHHAPQSRIWSRFDWSFQWCRLELQVYFIRMLLHQRQLSIFNQAAHRRQFHCRARRMNDMEQFQQPLILYTSCTWAAFKR